jgi:aryl-alcohol dehydrogenase-like predicted oxidoreductase
VSEASHTIRKRKLGKTGIEVTELALGSWGLCAESYGRVFPEQRLRTFARAIEQGVRVFDMAPTWGEDGASERQVAEAVGTRRSEMIYVTRGGLSAGEHGLEYDFSRAGLEACCERSLKRLDTDHTDLWLLHEPREGDLRRDDMHAAIETLKQSGKIRAWGVTVSHVDEARAALAVGAEVLSLPFSVLRQDLLREVADDAGARGVGVLARSVLLHGALAGRWSPKKKFLDEDHRKDRWSPEALAERVQQVSDLRFLVHDQVLSLASASLRFVLAHDVVSCAVIGPRTPGQVEAAVQSLASEPYLPPADLARAKKLG